MEKMRKEKPFPTQTSDMDLKPQSTPMEKVNKCEYNGHFRLRYGTKWQEVPNPDIWAETRQSKRNGVLHQI